MTTNHKPRGVTKTEIAIWMLIGLLAFGAAYSFIKAFGG